MANKRYKNASLTRNNNGGKGRGGKQQVERNHGLTTAIQGNESDESSSDESQEAAGGDRGRATAVESARRISMGSDRGRDDDKENDKERNQRTQTTMRRQVKEPTSILIGTIIALSENEG
jgi:hypothetical protein